MPGNHCFLKVAPLQEVNLAVNDSALTMIGRFGDAAEDECDSRALYCELVANFADAERWLELKRQVITERAKTNEHRRGMALTRVR